MTKESVKLHQGEMAGQPLSHVWVVTKGSHAEPMEVGIAATLEAAKRIAAEDSSLPHPTLDGWYKVTEADDFFGEQWWQDDSHPMIGDGEGYHRIVRTEVAQ